MSAEIFSTPGQHAMDSSFYTPIEPLIDIVDDAASGLSMLAQEVKQDGTLDIHLIELDVVGTIIG